MKMDITRTLIVLGALLHGTQTQENSTMTSAVTSVAPALTTTDKSSSGEPTTQRQTETIPPRANPANTPLTTNSTVETSITTPTGATSITNPNSATSINNPNDPPSATSPTGPTLQSSPSGVSQTSIQVMGSVEPKPTTQNLSAGNPSTVPSAPETLARSHTQNTRTTTAPESTSAVLHSHQTSEEHTSSVPLMSTQTPKKHHTAPGTFTVAFDLSKSSEGNVLSEACKTLGQQMKGNCSVKGEIVDKQITVTVTIDANESIPTELYKPPVQEENVMKGAVPDTLIAILASCGALVLILCCFAAYCTYHRRSYKNHQQHLTEELQTVENGYHDNPTLEVMEVQPEMQEKKVTLNGELNDSWIVPIDNLLKDEVPDEEDTHL